MVRPWAAVNVRVVTGGGSATGSRLSGEPDAKRTLVQQTKRAILFYIKIYTIVYLVVRN